MNTTRFSFVSMALIISLNLYAAQQSTPIADAEITEIPYVSHETGETIAGAKRLQGKNGKRLGLKFELVKIRFYEDSLPQKFSDLPKDEQEQIRNIDRWNQLGEKIEDGTQIYALGWTSNGVIKEVSGELGMNAMPDYGTAKFLAALFKKDRTFVLEVEPEGLMIQATFNLTNPESVQKLLGASVNKLAERKDC